MRRREVIATSGAVLVFGAGCLAPSPSQEQPETPPEDTPQDDSELSPTDGAQQSGSGAGITTTQDKLESYQDHETAIADGYERVEACIEGLGIPFVNDDIRQVSYDMPNTLLYEHSDSTQYELAGVEYFVPAAETDEPPELFAGEDRRTFQGPMEGHYPTQPTHYGLHVWLFTDNPNGRFALFNPRVTCSD